MKKRMLCTAALALSLMLTACSGSGTQQETTTAAATTEASAAETTEAETTEEETESPDELTTEGTISSVEANIIGITTDDGELTFDLSNAELSNDFPLSVGDEVGVTYYEGTTENPIPALVLDVYTSVIEENSDPVITGNITDATMNTVTIEDEEGDSYTFSTTNTYVVSKDGIVVDAAAEVTYIGDLEDTDPIPMASRIVTEDSFDTEDASLYKFHGEVIGIDGDNIVLEAEDGNMFTFTSDSLKFSSYSEGSSVEIEYIGSLTSKAIPAVAISTY